MRIGIDIRYLTHGLMGGVHTYVQNLVPELIRQSSQHHFFLYGDTKKAIELSPLHQRSTVRLLPYRNGLSSINHDLITLRKAMAEDQVEVAHFPANYGFAPGNAKKIITLHDEINIMPWADIIGGHPKNLRTVLMMTYLHLCSRAAVQKADLILTVSDYAKRQIRRYSKLDEEKIVAIHSGIDPGIHQITDSQRLSAVRSRYKLVRPFILADALKNPAVIVRAWEHLPQDLRNLFQIVFFSRKPNPSSIVQQAVDSGYATLLIKPPKEDLVSLYSQAKTFVFPSWIEGFGLPLLEAMACGAPVIASDRGSIPEIAGDAAIIIDAEDDQTLANHLISVLTSPELARSLQQKGYQRAAKFSWQSTAERTLGCYTSLA